MDPAVISTALIDFRRLLSSKLLQSPLSVLRAFPATMSTAGTIESLPIIDVTPFLNSDPSDESKRQATAAALHRACVDYGFFYLNIQAYVNASEPQELERLARAFFALSQEEKDKLSLQNQDFARGVHSQPHRYQ